MALASELRVAFVNLEALPSQTLGDIPQLTLQERGQVMPPGSDSTALTIFTKWNGTHFDLLFPCEPEDEEVAYTWPLSDALFFKIVRLAPDHACGYTATSLALNAARIALPLQFREPVERCILPEFDYIPAILLLVGTPGPCTVFLLSVMPHLHNHRYIYVIKFPYLLTNDNHRILFVPGKEDSLSAQLL